MEERKPLDLRQRGFESRLFDLHIKKKNITENFEPGDKVGYVEPLYIKNKRFLIFYFGYWDGEKAILDDGKIIVRKKEWLFKITTQLG